MYTEQAEKNNQNHTQTFYLLIYPQVDITAYLLFRMCSHALEIVLFELML